MGLRKKDFFIRKARKNHSKEVTRRRKNNRRKVHNRQKRKSTSHFIPQTFSRKEITLKLPENFTLHNDLQEVINFVANLKAYCNVSDQIYQIALNLEFVKRIDVGSISLLLSSIKELSIHNINVKGNLPSEPVCSQFIIDSGFLEHLEILSSDLRKKVSRKENSMIMNGIDRTDHRKIGLAIKTAMAKICGVERHYKPLYGVIGEMTINALEHAYKKRKHWLFAINFDQKKQKLIFTFTDNGFGIFNRLRKTFGLKAFSFLGLTSEIEIVEGMFDENYNSRFKKQFNRNQGLPAIRDLQDKNQVGNLIVITNGVYINFETNQKIELKNNFSGTYYYWELDINNLTHGKNTYKSS